MKYSTLIIISMIGGALGSAIVVPLYFSFSAALPLGATTARTTVTNPWTFTSTTTMNKPIIVTTTDSATSTTYLGCIQTTATSTASPIRFVIGSVATSSATYRGTNTVGLVGWQYGTCPNL